MLLILLKINITFWACEIIKSNKYYIKIKKLIEFKIKVIYNIKINLIWASKVKDIKLFG